MKKKTMKRKEEEEHQKIIVGDDWKFMRAVGVCVMRVENRDEWRREV
jgi:hypothetical protein